MLRSSMTLRALANALVVAGAAAASACGSSNSTPADAGNSSPEASSVGDSGHADAGHADAAPVDAGHVEASQGEASSTFDAGAADCGAIGPTGTQLVASTDPLILQGGRLTSDGYAFYLDANTQDLFVVPSVPSAGGSPANLGEMTSQSDTFWANGGKAALFLTAPCNPETLVAPLWVWTAATGAKEVSSSAFSWDSFNYTYDATQDGTEVAFYTTPGNGTASLTVTPLASGVPQYLVEGISLASQDCWPFVQYVGETIVAYYCLAEGAQAGSVTVASFAGPSYAQTTLATFPAPSQNAPLQAPAAIGHAGTQLLVTPAQGASDVALYPIAGGAPTTVSAKGQQAGFLSDGDVIVLNSDGTLERYSAPSAASDGGAADGGAGDAGTADAHALEASTSDGGGLLTLVGSSAGLEGLLNLSPDGHWLQVFTDFNDVDPFPTNVRIASATTPGPLTSVWNPLTASALGFTADSQFEAFVSPTGDAGAYELGASSVSGGSLITVPDIATATTFTGASKLIVGVNSNPLTGGADFKAVDLSNPTAASILVSQADPNYFYTGPTSNTLLYSWHCAATPASGVWALKAP